MNEENGLRGAKKYVNAEQKNERHVFCLESDEGFTPRGFSLIVRISLKNLINGNLYLNHI